MAKKTWADHYTRKAKAEGFAARSVYKLQEAQKKYGLLKPGDIVLDLGCAPGAWSQYALKVVGPSGKVVGVDLSAVNLSAPNFVFREEDVFELEVEELRVLSPKACYDVVLSDLAPKTIGERSADHFRSLHLARRAWELAQALLCSGGNFMVKVFEGEKFPDFKKQVQKYFQKTKLFRPKSTRSASREIFFIGLGYKGRP